MDDEDDPMEWMCRCGHRYGDHHVLDEDCCIEGCDCDGFNRAIIDDYPTRND